MATAPGRTFAAPSGLWTDSLAFPPLLAALALVLAHIWAALVLPPFNSNHLGCDACHHAILIHSQSLSDPAERALLADRLATYPQTSHWLAACWMPLLGGDAYKAMRAVSAASLLMMMGCQFALLRRALPAGPALLALLAWQLVCYLTNLANVHYYCASYFFSQGVGMTFVWGALLLVTGPANSAWLRGARTTLGVLTAGVAYLCHIVPGVAALGGLGLYFLACWLRAVARARREPAADATDGGRRPMTRAAALAGLTFVGAVGLAVVLGTGQLTHMRQASLDEGWVPVKNQALLFAWIPTLLAALAWVGSPRPRGRRPLPVEDLLEALTWVLAAAGLLHGFCAIEYAMGKVALYSVKKFYYVLFPVTTLIWFLAGAYWLQCRAWAQGDAWAPSSGRRLLAGWPARAAGAALAGLLLFLNARFFVANELVDEKVGPERNPVRVSQRLAREAPPEGGADGPRWRSDLVYFDPGLGQSSVYVNVVGLRRTWDDAYAVTLALGGWDPHQPPPAPLRQVRFSRLVLPPAEDSAGKAAAGGD